VQRQEFMRFEFANARHFLYVCLVNLKMNVDNLHSDLELLHQLKAGSQLALQEIYQRYHGVLYGHAYRRYPDREDVRDIIQEVFLQLWRTRETLSVSTNLSAYLYTAVRNRMLNMFRNKKVRAAYLQSLQHFIEKGENVVDAKLREKELIELVEQEVAALPSQMRTIFEMSRNLEMTHQEIAHELNLSPHTVRTQVRNALRILRIKLGTSIFLIFF